MIKIRTSALNILLLGALLTPVLASCGGAGLSQPPVNAGPVVTQPPVAAPGTQPVNLPPVAVTVDRSSIQLVERANVPSQTFILTVNRTAEQIPGLHLGNSNLLDPNSPGIGPSGPPEVRNGTTTWYMVISAKRAVQGEYTYALNISDMAGNIIGTAALKATVTHDLRIEADVNTWSPNERQVFALVNEVRTKGTLNGDAAAVAGTCAAGAATSPLRALLPSSVGYLAASAHAGWFGTYGYTAHVEPDRNFASFYGETLSDRAFRAMQTVGTSVSYIGLGENAAAGQTSPTEVMKAWLRSAGHCSNIMDPGYTHMAPGYAAAPAYIAQNRGNVYRDSWVQVFLSY